VREQVSTFWTRYLYFVGIREQNDVLRRELDAAKDELTKLRENAAEVERLRRLLSIAPPEEWKRQATRVITHRLGPNAALETFVIDKGGASGVTTNTPVVSPEGVVGRVLRYSPSAATVLLITDPNSRIPVVSQKSRAQGVLKGEGPDRELSLQYVPQGVSVEEGEILVTSGVEEIFPKGLPVARVTAVGRSGSSLFQVIRAAPLFGPQRLEEAALLFKGDPVPVAAPADASAPEPASAPAAPRMLAAPSPLGHRAASPPSAYKARDMPNHSIIRQTFQRSGMAGPAARERGDDAVWPAAMLYGPRCQCGRPSRPPLFQVHTGHGGLEVRGQVGQVGHGRRGQGHGPGGVLGNTVDLVRGAVDLLGGGRLLFGGGGDAAHLVRGLLHVQEDLAQGVAGIVGQGVGLLDAARGLVGRGHVAPGAFLDGLDEIADFLGGGHGLFGELAHFVGDHGEAAPGFAGPGGLDGGV